MNKRYSDLITLCAVGSTTVREFTQLTLSWFYSRQQVCGIFCGTCMLFVPLLVVLVILLTRRNPRAQLEYCTSAACTKALASLNTLLDEAVDPCHDFHAHVCGRWDSVTGGHVSYVDESVQRTAGRISRALLDVDSRKTLARETRLVSRFYQLCSSFMVEPSREALRADMLRAFSGFYDDLLTIKRYPDVLVRLIDLSLAQGVHTIFGVKLLRTANVEAVWYTRDVVADLIFGSHGDGGFVAANLFSLTRQSVLASSASFRWMGNAMQRRAKRTLSTMSLHLHDWSDRNVTFAAASDVGDAVLTGVTPAEFPAAYMRLRKEQQQMFLANANVKGAVDDGLHFFGNEAHFDAEGNALIVPASLRVQPLLYAKDVPPEFSAGTLGVLMAKEMYRAVIFDHGSDLWGNRERRAIARFEQCARVLASTMNVSVATPSVHLQEPSPHVQWMAAAATAFEAFRLASRSFRGASDVAHYWKPAQQTFFRRFCLLTCGAQEDPGGDALTSRIYCLLPIANMPQFAEAFGCTANYEEAFCVLE
ncbi:hypothetical protein HPB50_024163 [Hyalomma asiaticum]|uniref:Uncharacterized protein n=1 Tax=Hyalomma asiaticum TaxID=266040 RepID=A0ACB7SYS8_HYAAI|nr:hypothetical protein HPB50_024163 [Hyalomma asiaticum]